MYGKKGAIAVGADADFVVWEPKREKLLGKDTLHMRVDYSPFEGRTVPASPSHVLSRGELIVQNDQWVGKAKQGRGKGLRRGDAAFHDPSASCMRVTM
jgi:dihydropyrimidinase